MENRIKEIRESQNISQEKLARMTDLSRQTIVSAEQGTYDIKISTALKIAKALSTDVSTLFLL